jgi:hypothetical protein
MTAPMNTRPKEERSSHLRRWVEDKNDLGTSERASILEESAGWRGASASRDPDSGRRSPYRVHITVLMTVAGATGAA